jgi:uncharacterized protein (TIGR02145 family)
MVLVAGLFPVSSAPDAAPETQVGDLSTAGHSSRRMPDGNEWTTENLQTRTSQSYCYDDADSNCRRYGRLYTWAAAHEACQSLGTGWRLPTDDEWRHLAKQFGGLGNDSEDGGKRAYQALLVGGNSGFNAVLGGGRDLGDGQYGRAEAHGFYWTASESDPGSAWFYNFAKGRQSLFRQRAGEKERAFSVRCIRQ